MTRREIRQKEQALDDEMQKQQPDKAKIEELRHELSYLQKSYDERRMEFERRWNPNDGQ